MKTLKNLKLINKIEKITDTRYYYYVNNDFIIEITHCDANLQDKSSLMNLWYKNGYITKKLNNYLVVNTYYTTENGCFGKYNITTKLTKDRKREVINFDYLLEDTEENRKLLLNKCISLYLKDNK